MSLDPASSSGTVDPPANNGLGVNPRSQEIRDRETPESEPESNNSDKDRMQNRDTSTGIPSRSNREHVGATIEFQDNASINREINRLNQQASDLALQQQKLIEARTRYLSAQKRLLEATKVAKTAYMPSDRGIIREDQLDLLPESIPTETRRRSDESPPRRKVFKPQLLEEYPPKGGYTGHKNWVKTADYIFELAGPNFPDNKTKIKYAVQSLKGIAKIRWFQYAKEHGIDMTWTEFCDFLINLSSDKESRSL